MHPNIGLFQPIVYYAMQNSVYVHFNLESSSNSQGLITKKKFNRVLGDPKTTPTFEDSLEGLNI